MVRNSPQQAMQRKRAALVAGNPATASQAVVQRRWTPEEKGPKIKIWDGEDVIEVFF
jgi:hypothetical protein